MDYWEDCGGVSQKMMIDCPLANQKRIAVTASLARRPSKKERKKQTEFQVGGVCNMMSVPAEGAERLAEILREIFALSEPNRPMIQSTAADDPIEIRVYDEAGNVIETHEHTGEFKEPWAYYFDLPARETASATSRLDMRRIEQKKVSLRALVCPESG
jgi:hypothetical protein